MAEYTPSMEQVRDCYQMSEDGLDFKHRYFERAEEFDRWLAAHDAEVRAQALEDAEKHFSGENFSHTVTTPTLFQEPRPGRYGDSRDQMTGHLLQVHDRNLIRRWLRSEAARIRQEADRG